MRIDKLNYEFLTAWFDNLKNNTQPLDETYGVGSRSSSPASLSKASRTSSSSWMKSRQIAQIISHCGCSLLIEMGTNLGKATSVIASLVPQLDIHTIEAQKEYWAHAKKLFDSMKLNQIHTYNCLFQDFLDSRQDIIEHADAFFIDGDHSYTATLNIFNRVYQKNRFGVYIIDDIYWSQGMTKAWKEITEGLDQHVQIVDFFNYGLIIRSENFTGKSYTPFIAKKWKPLSNWGLKA